MSIYTVHAGHAKDGNRFCGATGFCRESVENRIIKDSVMKYLRIAGHTVHDCTVDEGASVSDVITKIKKKINSCTGATANISIHLNAFSKSSYDGKIKGTEALVYSNTGQTSEMAARICGKIAALGFTNRGIKVRTDLGVLKGITNGGINVLVEAFFCDDEDDYKQYLSCGGADAFGKAIAEGILNCSLSSSDTDEIYRIRKSWEDAASQIGAYTNFELAKAACKEGYSVYNKSGAAAYSIEEKKTSGAVFNVKILDDSLNVRKGPGTGYPAVMSIRDHGVYGITETSGSWGKLKSGIGWICISEKYVKRVG